MEHFTTECVADAHRISYWNDVNSQTFTGLDVRCAQANSYHAALSRISLGELTIAVPSSSEAQLRHTKRHISKSDARCLLVHGQISGSSTFIQGARAASLEPGDFLVADDATEYEFAFSSNTQMYVVRIPEQALGAARVLTERTRGIKLPGDAAETKLLRGYIFTLWNHILAQDQAILPVHAGKILIDLVEMACAPFASARRSKTIGAVRREAICEFVDTHLFEPCLTSGHIAASLGISPRYVQRLFAEMDTTPSLYIAQQRLWSAAKLLSDPTQGHRSVSEIAYAVGFNDLSHFGRQFKARFGTSPKLYRQRALSA